MAQQPTVLVYGDNGYVGGGAGPLGDSTSNPDFWAGSERTPTLRNVAASDAEPGGKQLFGHALLTNVFAGGGLEKRSKMAGPSAVLSDGKVVYGFNNSTDRWADPTSDDCRVTIFDPVTEVALQIAIPTSTGVVSGLTNPNNNYGNGSWSTTQSFSPNMTPVGGCEVTCFCPLNDGRMLVGLTGAYFGWDLVKGEFPILVILKKDTTGSGDSLDVIANGWRIDKAFYAKDMYATAITLPGGGVGVGPFARPPSVQGPGLNGQFTTVGFVSSVAQFSLAPNYVIVGTYVDVWTGATKSKPGFFVLDLTTGLPVAILPLPPITGDGPGGGGIFLSVEQIKYDPSATVNTDMRFAAILSSWLPRVYSNDAGDVGAGENVVWELSFNATTKAITPKSSPAAVRCEVSHELEGAAPQPCVMAYDLKGTLFVGLRLRTTPELGFNLPMAVFKKGSLPLKSPYHSDWSNILFRHTWLVGQTPSDPWGFVWNSYQYPSMAQNEPYYPGSSATYLEYVGNWLVPDLYNPAPGQYCAFPETLEIDGLKSMIYTVSREGKLLVQSYNPSLTVGANILASGVTWANAANGAGAKGVTSSTNITNTNPWKADATKVQMNLLALSGLPLPVGFGYTPPTDAYMNKLTPLTTDPIHVELNLRDLLWGGTTGSTAGQMNRVPMNLTPGQAYRAKVNIAYFALTEPYVHVARASIQFRDANGAQVGRTIQGTINAWVGPDAAWKQVEVDFEMSDIAASQNSNVVLCLDIDTNNTNPRYMIAAPTVVALPFNRKYLFDLGVDSMRGSEDGDLFGWRTEQGCFDITRNILWQPLTTVDPYISNEGAPAATGGSFYNPTNYPRPTAETCGVLLEKINLNNLGKYTYVETPGGDEAALANKYHQFQILQKREGAANTMPGSPMAATYTVGDTRKSAHPHLFWVDYATGKLTHSWKAGEGWLQEDLGCPLSGGFMKGVPPSAANDGRGNLWVIVRGSDNRLYVRFKKADRRYWEPWPPTVTPSFTVMSNPVVVGGVGTADRGQPGGIGPVGDMNADNFGAMCFIVTAQNGTIARAFYDTRLAGYPVDAKGATLAQLGWATLTPQCPVKPTKIAAAASSHDGNTASSLWDDGSTHPYHRVDLVVQDPTGTALWRTGWTWRSLHKRSATQNGINQLASAYGWVQMQNAPGKMAGYHSMVAYRQMTEDTIIGIADTIVDGRTQVTVFVHCIPDTKFPGKVKLWQTIYYQDYKVADLTRSSDSVASALGSLKRFDTLYDKVQDAAADIQNGTVTQQQVQALDDPNDLLIAVGGWKQGYANAKSDKWHQYGPMDATGQSYWTGDVPSYAGGSGDNDQWVPGNSRTGTPYYVPLLGTVDGSAFGNPTPNPSTSITDVARAQFVTSSVAAMTPGYDARGRIDLFGWNMSMATFDAYGQPAQASGIGPLWHAIGNFALFY